MISDNTKKPLTRICTFYAVGKSEKELLGFDEYDSHGSGLYFTDDLFMCNRYLFGKAYEIANREKLKKYDITITKTGKKYDTKIEDPDSFLSSLLGEPVSITAPKKISAPKKNKGKDLAEL